MRKRPSPTLLVLRDLLPGFFLRIPQHSILDWRLAGEAEARNAIYRLRMLEQDRRLLSPEQTEDVPRGLQILRY